MAKYLVIDGELNGTGIRDYYESGYIDPATLNISDALLHKLKVWLEKYNNEHFYQFANEELINMLDEEGLEITREIKKVLASDVKIQYFSAARMKTLTI